MVKVTRKDKAKNQTTFGKVDRGSYFEKGGCLYLKLSEGYSNSYFNTFSLSENDFTDLPEFEEVCLVHDVEVTYAL